MQLFFFFVISLFSFISEIWKKEIYPSNKTENKFWLVINLHHGPSLSECGNQWVYIVREWHNLLKPYLTSGINSNGRHDSYTADQTISYSQSFKKMNETECKNILKTGENNFNKLHKSWNKLFHQEIVKRLPFCEQKRENWWSRNKLVDFFFWAQHGWICTIKSYFGCPFFIFKLKIRLLFREMAHFFHLLHHSKIKNLDKLFSNTL